MASTTKTPKDKPYAPSPRVLPRPTAASAARAARNATNRNLTVPPQYRHSPTRAQSSPTYKAKLSAPRGAQKSDSKTSVKIIRNSENDESVSYNNTPLPQEAETFIVKDTLAMSADEVADDKNSTGEFINQEAVENYVFVTERVGESQNELEIDVCPKDEHGLKSRPQTPVMASRPLTPKSLQSSRPQTPCVLSRPTTPAHPLHTTPASRPNTPQQPITPIRPRTPSSLPVPVSNKVWSPSSVCSQPHSIKDEDDLRSLYILKQKQFHRMKKELDLKQQTILEVFDSLRGLHERLMREGISGGGEGFQQQDLVVFNVADWAQEEVSQLCRDAAAASITEGAVELINTTVPIDESALADLDAKVVNVPARFADLCLQAFTERQELIDWVKKLMERNVIQQDDGSGETLERITRYNTQGLELCETLRELKSRADDVLDAVTQLWKRACRERSALVVVGESLVREIARLRQDLEVRAANATEIRENRGETETTKVLEDTRRELEEERVARAVTKDKLANTESQLRQTRIRVSKMDRQLREAEASISCLTGTVKTLEDQSRQREVQLEARARKLKESLKTGEVASGQLVQQRDALQAEVLDLKEQIESLTAQHKSAILDLTNQLKNSKNAYEEQRCITQKEIEEKEALQAALMESQNSIEEIKTKITELENSRPNPDLPTEREMDLWAELQATKDTLRMAEDDVTACRREKNRFLETLTKIAETENKVGMQQKLAAELLGKEEIVGKMQMQIRDMTKTIKLNEQKVIQYEQYVRDLQAHNRAVANCQESPKGISYQDLQQEIMNLRMSLLEAVHRNEELSEILVQKEQQLEQQDKTSRAQARVIKVREELINMLKNKETEQSRELSALQQDLEHRMKIVDDVNKQIAAKAEEIQELFATLENKQQQIHRLEKIVLALEEQQRRAQAQRTRHEEKIAALEHELAASGNRRERKFLFF